MVGRSSAAAASLALALASAGCISYYEVSIETPNPAVLDVSPFRRVLVAGFLSAGSPEVDTNLETVRLLRSQLRSKSTLSVIDADVLELGELTGVHRAERGRSRDKPGSSDTDRESPAEDGPTVADDESIFANAAFWKAIGQEYQEPLIITGTLRFLSQIRPESDEWSDEQFDAFGRRRVLAVRRGLRDRTAFVLLATFVLIDGRSGTVLHRASYAEQASYDLMQTVPALSAYFELMDRVVPSFLNLVTDQSLPSSRFLLK